MSSTAQKINFSLFGPLMNQLENYGLNPRDWKIQRASFEATRARFEMHHREDRDFRFRGRLARAANGGAYLENLTLISI